MKAYAGTLVAGSTFTHQLANRMIKVIRHTDESNKQCNVTFMQQEANLYQLRTEPVSYSAEELKQDTGNPDPNRLNIVIRQGFEC